MTKSRMLNVVLAFIWSISKLIWTSKLIIHQSVGFFRIDQKNFNKNQIESISSQAENKIDK